MSSHAVWFGTLSGRTAPNSTYTPRRKKTSEDVDVDTCVLSRTPNALVDRCDKITSGHGERGVVVVVGRGSTCSARVAHYFSRRKSLKDATAERRRHSSSRRDELWPLLSAHSFVVPIDAISRHAHAICTAAAAVVLYFFQQTCGFLYSFRPFSERTVSPLNARGLFIMQAKRTVYFSRDVKSRRCVLSSLCRNT